MTARDASRTPQVAAWLDALTLDERCRLLGGATNWRTHAVERVGIPALKLSDGPNGVRGEEAHAAGGARGVAVPVEIAQGASWDPALVARLGDLLGREAVRKGVHVLLAPGVNLHRTPIGGRTFEYYSEDPELSGRLAVAMVRAVQAHSVGVTVKHFVANDTEVDRFTVDVDVDERVLRELYLRPFEAAVTEAGAWGVMSAYNRLGGEFCSGNATLLRTILRGEWRFDGVVVSDWFAAHDTVASARAGLTLEMPGPARIYGERLRRAVDAGDVDATTVEDLVAELLVLVERTQATQRPAERPEESLDDPDDRALCREAAVAGTVLLRNERGTLPLDASQLRALAVVGPNAGSTRIMGGGSSALATFPHRSVLDALEARAGARIVHERGVRIDRYTPMPAARQLVGPDGRPGLELRFVDADDEDEVLYVGRTSTTLLGFFGSTPGGVDPRRARLRLAGGIRCEAGGTYDVGAIVSGPARVVVGDVVVVDDPEQRLPRGEAFYRTGTREAVVALEVRAGDVVPVAVEMDLRGGYGGVRLGFSAPEPADAIDRAVAAAAGADAAVVVVGTNEEWETEGDDRTTIALPGEQDELVRRIAAANPRTVVVVNAGAPVAMPWLDDVGAVLVPFFGGIEMADAVVDIVLGEADPGGRLPVTFPRRLEDSPAWAHYRPVDGVQRYAEGLLMGYRGFDAAGVEPLFPFGHGLTYGDVEWVAASLGATVTSVRDLERGAVVPVAIRLRNHGSKTGTAVVQVYVAPLEPPVPRPPKELGAFAKRVLAPGEEATLHVDLGVRALRRWDAAAPGWVVDPGEYDIVVAASANDERARLRLTVEPAPEDG